MSKAKPQDEVKAPPHDAAAEAALLGAVLLDNERLAMVSSLRPEQFYRGAHREIWRAMLALAKERRPIDAVTLSERLRELGTLKAAGGGSYLVQLSTETPAVANVEHYARIVREKAKQRDIIGAARELADEAGRTGASDDAVDAALNTFNEAVALATAAPIEARSLRDLYGLDAFEADQERELLSIASLPQWGRSDHEYVASGYGWGAALNETLGGGIHPGYTLAIGAASAKAGKTSFLMQPLLGLALRSYQLSRDGGPGPLTPIIMASEMAPQALMWRALASWTGYPAGIFRAGRSAKALDAEAAREAAREALGGDFGAALEWIRPIPAGERRTGAALLDQMGRMVKRWVRELAARYKRAEADVWPIVVLDPIQRWQSRTMNEVEALNELAEVAIEKAQTDRWIVLMTSDTNKSGGAKDGATGGAKDGATGGAGTEVFRGSYKLMHAVDAALLLERKLDRDDGHGEVNVKVALNRWGPAKEHAFTWRYKLGRFEPIETASAPGKATATKGNGAAFTPTGPNDLLRPRR
jgi:hypothetical protein